MSPRSADRRAAKAAARTARLEKVVAKAAKAIDKPAPAPVVSTGPRVRVDVLEPGAEFAVPGDGSLKGWVGRVLSKGKGSVTIKVLGGYGLFGDKDTGYIAASTEVEAR